MVEPIYDKINDYALVTIKLAAQAGSNRVETVEKALFHGDSALLRQWSLGEPLYLELPITLPDSTATSFSFEFGIRYGNGAWHWHPLSTVAAGTNIVVAEPALLRYPSGLAGPISPELFQLESQLLDLRQRRKNQRDSTLVDKPLAEALARACGLHDARGEIEDAYLACQWAMQADPDQARFLHRRLHALRPKTALTTVDFLRELDLLHSYYAHGRDEDAYVLSQYLSQRRRPREASYFKTRLR